MEINLKRYPTPYPEDLKNMVKSVQSLVGKSVHAGHGLQHQHQQHHQHQHQHQLSTGTATSAGTNMEHTHLSKEPYEPPWPLPPKEVETHKCIQYHHTVHISVSVGLRSVIRKVLDTQHKLLCVCFPGDRQRDAGLLSVSDDGSGINA